MSAPKTQISPIPPVDYGNRFIRFITGHTKTKEEAERESHSTEQPLDGSIHTDRHPSVTLSRHSTDRVIQKAEKQAQKSEKQGASDEGMRDRTLTADRAGGAQGATLPVVEEDGEAGSREDSIRHDKPAGHIEDATKTEVEPVGSGETVIVRPKGKENEEAHRHLPSLPHIPRLSMSGTPGTSDATGT